MVEGFEILDADVFVPEVGFFLDEFVHEGNAAGVVEVGEVDAFGFEEVFGAEEVFIFADDDGGDAVEEGGAGAHDAGGEGGDEDEGGPVAAAAGVADADDFGVSGGIAGLDAEVVSDGEDGAGGGGEDGADGEAAFAVAFEGLFVGGFDEGV